MMGGLRIGVHRLGVLVCWSRIYVPAMRPWDLGIWVQDSGMSWKSSLAIRVEGYIRDSPNLEP